VREASVTETAGRGKSVRTRLLHAIPITLVIATIVVGVVIVAGDRWRLGSAVLAAAAALGGLLRLVLPTTAVGVLAVRSRVFDTAIFLAIAALMAGMALVTVTPHA
jgi:hypothetical protein